MSVPFHLLPCLDLPYNHIKFIKCEVRDIRGDMEIIRRGMESHAKYFSQEKLNSRYLNRHARRFSSLEGAVDSWVYWASQMPKAKARYEIDVLQDRVFRFMMQMGLVAEAYHWSICPAWNCPKTMTPWHQFFLTRVRKLKLKLKAAWHLISHQKEKISTLLNSRDLAQEMERKARNAAHLAKDMTNRARVWTRRARQDASKAKTEAAAARTELQNLQIEILCLKFQNINL